jgi:hypothetical protein
MFRLFDTFGVDAMNLLPAVDPIPLPAPVWLFKLLHIVTLVLHFYAVHFLVGGLVCASLWAIFGRRRQDDVMMNASGAVTYRLPVVMAYVINLGVPPLLFAQVLYGRALYTSSVLIGVSWISVIFLVIASYYILYMMSKRAETGRAFGWLGLIAIIIVMKVGMIYSTNMTLMLRPDAWPEMYRTDPLGAASVAGDPTTTPRWAFMMIGSLGVTGIGLMLLSLRGTLGQDVNVYLRKWGGRLLAVFTLVQVILAFQVLRAQPDYVRAGLAESGLYMGTGIAWAATALLLVPLGILVSLKAGRRNGWLITAVTAVNFVNLLTMVVYRDAVRDVALGYSGFDVWERAVHTNWLTVGVFLILFVVAILFIGWMGWVVLRTKGGKEQYA